MSNAEVLKRWYLARVKAQENPQLLLAGSPPGLCAERMEDLAVAEGAMFALKGEPLVDLFKAAEADKGCSRCWVSSRVTKEHPECETKIVRWFALREALMAYVGVMYFGRRD